MGRGRFKEYYRKSKSGCTIVYSTGFEYTPSCILCFSTMGVIHKVKVKGFF